MKVLYIERSLVKNDMIFDQMARLKNYVKSHLLTIQIGSTAHLNGVDITSVRSPFIPKWERLKGYTFCHTALKAFKALHKVHKFDLIHAYFAYPHALAAYEISRQFGIPYIITGRGDDVLGYPKRNQYLHKSVSKALQNCSGYIGVSQHIVDAAVALGADPQKCLFRPNGIPIEIFNWNEKQEADRKKHNILFVGKMIPRKNVYRLLDAFKLVLKENSQARLELAGSGIQEQELRKYAQDIGVGSSTVFHGEMKHSALMNLQRRATVMVLPSHSEGWPNVVMEAMACGTPVVGSNRCGMPEQIINETYGYLCEPEDTSDIAAKLSLALKQNWDPRHISDRGTLYSRDQTAEVIYNYYQKVLDNHE
jgi:teichuronic acid biosynthesis glycosyltransferase TuaC